VSWKIQITEACDFVYGIDHDSVLVGNNSGVALLKFESVTHQVSTTFLWIAGVTTVWSITVSLFELWQVNVAFDTSHEVLWIIIIPRKKWKNFIYKKKKKNLSWAFCWELIFVWFAHSQPQLSEYDTRMLSDTWANRSQGFVGYHTLLILDRVLLELMGKSKMYRGAGV
jgi:hypothetical protein